MSLPACLRSITRFQLTLICGLLLLVAAPVDWSTPSAAQATDQTKAAKEPIEGRIWNLSDKPFTFRLRRRDGVAWGAPITVEPGKYFALRSDGKEASELEGITGKGTGHVSIEYAELGGKIRLQLPAQDKADDLVPYWFHVKDANGFSRLIQAKSVEDAEEQQKLLQQEPKLSPQEIAGIKKMLKANWVLFD